MAVLRSLASGPLSKTTFSALTGLSGDTKYRRQINPALWKPAEIYRLGVDLGLSDASSTNHLQGLAALIDCLSVCEKKVVCKAGSLTTEKLQLRQRDSTGWQAQELDKLNLVVVNYSVRQRASGLSKPLSTV